MPSYPKEDCYETLGIHPEAAQDVIDATVKQLRQAYHPDRLAQASERDRLFAEEKLKKINQAYEFVKDPDTRRSYDEWRSSKRPKPRVSPEELDFGTLNPGESTTKRLTINNDGGPVVGEINISLSNDPSRFSLAVEASQGFPIMVSVTFDGTGTETGERYTNSFTVSLDGVSVEVPAMARVRSEFKRPSISKAPADPPPRRAGAAAAPAASPVLSRGWAITLGCAAGLLYIGLINLIGSLALVSLLPNPPHWLDSLGGVWLISTAILLGVIVAGLVRGRNKRAAFATLLATIFTLVFALLFRSAVMESMRNATLEEITQENTLARGDYDPVAGGQPHGISYGVGLSGRAAVFSRAAESRIEFPRGIPREGTLEWWIKIDSAYRFDNFVLHQNEKCALLFASDVEGGDVAWPGATKLFVCNDGQITLDMAQAKYNDKPHQQLRVGASNFRFSEWHALGISYGTSGQTIILDGQIIGSEPHNTQSLGVAGTHQGPVDVPTIGEAVSHFWGHRQYSGGFEGRVNKFRLSTKQNDWLLAKRGLQMSSASDTPSLPRVEVQSIASPQDADVVAKAFLAQGRGVAQITLGATVVARPYALQSWSNENGGGEALLEQASSTGWTLVSLGGGEWDILLLMEEGVPRAHAEHLVAGANNGALPASATRPIAVPAGNVITVATPSGRVTMKNFYRSAAYLAPDQHAVVIQQAPDYDIVYDVSDSHFVINMFLKPLGETRRAAEAAFLETLNISEQDACKLTVGELVTGLASSQYAGNSFPLSFCIAR